MVMIRDLRVRYMNKLSKDSKFLARRKLGFLIYSMIIIANSVLYSSVFLRG